MARDIKTVVVTSFDENYMPYARCLIKSFSDNYNNEEAIEFYCLVPEHLLKDEVAFKNSFPIKDKVVVSFKSSEQYNELVRSGVMYKTEWFSFSAWHRMFVDSVCKGFDKVIYLDPDIIINRDVSPLLDYPLYNKFAALIQDDFSTHCLETYGTYDHPYINDGVFIADLNHWSEYDLTGKMVEHMVNKTPTKFIEQDIFSLHVQPFLQPLPISFNFFPYKEELYGSIGEPLVIHFNGSIKPWHGKNNNRYNLEWHRINDSMPKYHNE